MREDEGDFLQGQVVLRTQVAFDPNDVDAWFCHVPAAISRVSLITKSVPAVCMKSVPPDSKLGDAIELG